MNGCGKKVQTVSVVPSAVKASDKTTISVAYDSTVSNDTSLVYAAPSHRNHTRKQNRSRKARYRDYKNLKPWQVRLVFEADAAARWLDQPLTYFLTINWSYTLYGGLDGKGFKLGMKRLSQWLRDHGLQPLWVYTHENPPGDEGYSKANTHVLLRLPHELRETFEARLGPWFKAANPHAIDFKRRYGQREKPLQYMTKGGDYLTCKRFGGSRSKGKGGQGIVAIKRAGASKALIQAINDMKAAGQSSTRWGRGYAER